MSSVKRVAVDERSRAGEFNFEEEVKLFVRKLEAFVASTEHIGYANGESGGIRTNKLISCQIVNYGTVTGSLNQYYVYNCCHQLDEYKKAHSKYFDVKSNKSILPIYHDHEIDDGIWYRERPSSPTEADDGFQLHYEENTATANLIKFETPTLCLKEWDKWTNLIFNLYGSVGSVFAKNLQIPIDKSTTLYSGIYLSFACTLNYKQVGIIGVMSETLLHQIVFKSLIPTLYGNIQRQATRAAISQVMARNMSHNIGSHVLSRMVERGIVKKIIEQCNPTEANSDFVRTQRQYQGFQTTDHSLSEPENLIASFNSYMKSRMDYLADVTTGVPTIENSKWFIKEVLAGIDQNRLLLDRISGISDFHYRFKVENLTRPKEGPEVNDDLMISVPNDVLGCHAFYIILENIIRNCAKHGRNGSKGTRADDPLSICIDIRECAEEEGRELYEFTIHDDSNVTGDVAILSREEKEKYGEYFGERSRATPIRRLDKLVFDQNYQLNQSVLKDGALRHGAWGLIEMDASAAYLRKIPVEEIDSRHYDIDLRQGSDSKRSHYPADKRRPEALNILKAVAVGGKHLGYRLLMYKPREVLVIDDNNICSSLGEAERNDLLKSGILVCALEGRKGKFVYDSGGVYNHTLVVVLSDDPDKVIGGNRTGLSQRILALDSDSPLNHSLVQLLRTNSKGELWKHYIKNKEFKFYRKYEGISIDDKVLTEIIQGKATNGSANYFDHGKRYNANANYKEIKYSAVEGFLPTVHDVVKGMQFIESIHTKIVVMDERIQEYARHAAYGTSKIAMKVIYANTGIHVPDCDKDCNLGAQSFDRQFNKILKYIWDQRDASFFVIHLGIIEKLIESHNRRSGTRKYNRKSQVKDFLGGVVCAHHNNIDYNKLIVISGRGKPDNLPQDTRYLNYSIISQYMIELRFKYLLSEAVFSARKLH